MALVHPSHFAPHQLGPTPDVRAGDATLVSAARDLIQQAGPAFFPPPLGAPRVYTGPQPSNAGPYPPQSQPANPQGGSWPSSAWDHTSIPPPRNFVLRRPPSESGPDMNSQPDWDFNSGPFLAPRLPPAAPPSRMIGPESTRDQDARLRQIVIADPNQNHNTRQQQLIFVNSNPSQITRPPQMAFSDPNSNQNLRPQVIFSGPNHNQNTGPQQAFFPEPNSGHDMRPQPAVLADSNANFPPPFLRPPPSKQIIAPNFGHDQNARPQMLSSGPTLGPVVARPQPPNPAFQQFDPTRDAHELIKGHVMTGNLTMAIHSIGDEAVYRGSYSDVYKACFGREPVAVKVLKRINGKTGEAMNRKYCREWELWVKAKHRNIAPILGYAEGSKFGPVGALISKWYANGDASKYIKAKGDSLNIWDRIDLWAGVIAGVGALHALEIVHGDIKPGNVLIDDYGVPQICDFGLARILEQESRSSELETTSEFTGTTRYMSKELFLNELVVPTKQSDVWALGCLGLEFLCNVLPYADKSNNRLGQIHLYQDIKSGQLPAGLPGIHLQADHRIGHAALRLLESCWWQDPSRRPTAEYLCERAMNIQGILPPILLSRPTSHSIVSTYAYMARKLGDMGSQEDRYLIFGEVGPAPCGEVFRKVVSSMWDDGTESRWEVESIHWQGGCKLFVNSRDFHVIEPDYLLARFFGPLDMWPWRFPDWV